ncbi:peroxiredoxin (alkyl hydroperoxide reductase subunit C) [Halanaerobium saccharolyticum]|uniref:Peroxiredoxin (Alkyl hydroperoxide reductase subunit C) n=1 Tax=Halanaerobium saccharolyticum TaxID=43595 RepID=A0A2T5RGA9_9FIRM|nr:peroxiredoxin (alkyl hydroperoxide reductase subunit C) [Halanaerobium saccharolyticum]PUU93163.1 MAG: peroxiredoxin (alkyl hydroperoxide reductase subunit C) [Halanaerobium sp.]TDP84425.1 peroxiredoxin (alkyl hydroperoxide reductase subunit C) [Halanaerobium saccharolyticum]
MRDLGVEVIAVSTNSIQSHKIWDETELSQMVEGGIPYPMVSDSAGKVGKKFGVYDEDAGIDVRGRFIIDPDGVLQAMEVLTPPVGRNVEELIRQVQAFQLVRETGGKEVTPSGWRPGKPTLKPGPDAVGKIYKQWTPDNAFNE